MAVRFLIDSQALMRQFADCRERALEFAATAPSLEDRLKAMGAAEAFESLADGLSEKIAAAQAEAGESSGN